MLLINTLVKPLSGTVSRVVQTPKFLHDNYHINHFTDFSITMVTNTIFFIIYITESTENEICF